MSTQNSRSGNFVESFTSRMYPQNLFDESSTKLLRLGTVRRLVDGREFVYASFTAANLTAGCCVSKVQTPVAGTIAAADALLCTVGARSISITAAAITKDQLVDGELVIKSGTGIGNKFKIRGNGATDGIASGRVAIELYDKLNVALLTADSVPHVYANPYKDLLINPAVANEDATTQETVMGVTIRPVTASYYAWIQTKGLGSLVLDIDSPAGAEANEMQIVSGTTAGRGAIVIPLETTFFWGTQILGHTLESADLTDASANLVMLDI